MKKIRKPSRIGRLLSLLAMWSFFLWLLAGCGNDNATGGTIGPILPVQLKLTGYVSGLNLPVGMEAPADGTGRLFVICQGGTIRIIQNNLLLTTPFLNLTATVESGGEKGLLGLAFHPSYSANRRFFVNYTRRVGAQLMTVVSGFTAQAANPNLADPASEVVLLTVDQPFDNHNGGQLAFGPDGFLYIALGDGGSGGDPSGNAQNLTSLLGKILRIDVNGAPAAGKQYAIPADNPFAGGGGLPEIWAYGLRNPWRFSFDPPTGRLFAGDVGEASWEEVDLIVRGRNYGWNIMEGNHCYPAGVTTCNTAGLTAPINEYGHDATGGVSIIGGFFYRGSSIPALVGYYVFGDLTSGRIWGLKEVLPDSWQRTQFLTHGLTVSSFGRDASGELYVVDYGNGAILRLQSAP